MRTSIIVAMSQDRLIGKENQIPWKLPEDLKRFMKITTGHPVIMGRKTFESMGKPLPNRTNIVATRNSSWKAEGALTASSIQEALKLAEGSEGAEEIFLIGGTRIFQEALKFADRIYLTIVDGKFEGDVYFPDTDLKTLFDLEKESEGTSEKNPDLSYTYFLGKRRKDPLGG